MPPGKDFSIAEFISEIIARVDPGMKRTGDSLLDLAEVKTVLANRNPMTEADRQAWEIADHLQQDVMNAPRYLIAITTNRGRRQLVLPEDLQVKVGADGFIRAYSDWGPLTEKLLPFDQATEINAGGEDELQ